MVFSDTFILCRAKSSYGLPLLGLGISAQLANQNNSVLTKITLMGSTKFLNPPQAYPDKSACHFPTICNQVVPLEWDLVIPADQQCQYSCIFESLTVIGWLFKGVYPVNIHMYINEERERRSWGILYAVVIYKNGCHCHQKQSSLQQNTALWKLIHNTQHTL